MRRAARTGAAAVIAAILLVAAAVLNLRGGEPEGSVGGASAAGPASALLGPGVGARSLETSIAALQDRLSVAPEDWRGYASLGIAYVARARVTADPGWYPMAEEALRESLRLRREDNGDALLGLGILALSRHDFEGALELGRRAETANPYDADVYGVIGDALLELGRYEKAFDAFQVMVDSRPSLASYARVSYARELLGDLAGARDAMERAFAAAGSPQDAAWAAHEIGQLAWKRGDVEAAGGWYERGLELEPSYVPNLAGLANVAWARGNLDLAVERYLEVVARYPSVEYVATLGDLFATSGRPGLASEQYAVVDATRELARAAGVNVDLEVALFDADHGRPRSALAAAEAEWARRRSVHVADAYAWALHAAGRNEDAVHLMDRALALGTRDALVLFHAAMIELALGRQEDAGRLLRRALATNPNFSVLHAATARRTLERIEGGR